MQKNVTAANITLTPDVSAYLDKKLAHIERILNGHAEGAVLNIEIGKSTMHHQNGDVYEAKAQLRGMGHEHVVEVSAGSLFAAIDLLKDDLTTELAKEKDKNITMIRRGGRAIKNMVKSLWPWGTSENTV